MTEPDDLVETLTRRHDVLRALLDEPRERHALVDDLDPSKSTIYKGVSQLQERGLVEPTSDGLRPTLFGVVALERYDELARTADLGELLADLPPETIGPSALVGADSVVPDRRSVDRHPARLERMFREAESIRGFSPAVSPEQSSIFHDRTVNNRLEAEYVLPTEIVSHLHRVDPAGLEETVAAENVVFYQTDRDRRITHEVTTEHVAGHEGRYGLASAAARPNEAGEGVSIADFEAADSKRVTASRERVRRGRVRSERVADRRSAVVAGRYGESSLPE